MRKWHAGKCAEWNSKNRRSAQENYLHDKLTLAVGESEEDNKTSTATASKSPDFASGSVFLPQLPRSLIQEVIAFPTKKMVKSAFDYYLATKVKGRLDPFLLLSTFAPI
jgi:phage terminase large subunit-like protein